MTIFDALREPRYYGFDRSRSGEIDVYATTVDAPEDSAAAGRAAAALLGTAFVVWEGPDGRRVRRSAQGRRLAAWTEA